MKNIPNALNALPQPTPDYSESLLVHFRRVESLKEAALDYPSISLNKRQLCDLELLLNRAFYPLRGYLNRADYESVLNKMRLTDGTLWPIPTKKRRALPWSPSKKWSMWKTRPSICLKMR
jgi:hypothetical protein